MVQKGIIIKGVGSFYDVLTNDKVIRCRLRGRLRLEGIRPLVGDNVLVRPATNVQEASIEEILPRKNHMQRPTVSNISNLIVILAAKKPSPDLLLVDKLLVYAEHLNIKPILVINKIDLVQDEYLNRLKKEFLNTGYPCYPISVIDAHGVEEFKKYLEGISVLAGQSGVGKSSIINALSSSHKLETGEISKKLNRGRHTTRHVELLILDDGGMIVDTPGFSQLSLLEIPQEGLQDKYPDFTFHKSRCRFTGCQHNQEPDCAVRDAVEQGQISQGRYERYLILLEDLAKQRRY